jgi:hypothetical protein
MIFLKLKDEKTDGKITVFVEGNKEFFCFEGVFLFKFKILRWKKKKFVYKDMENNNFYLIKLLKK